MKIVFFGNGQRGMNCLKSLCEKGYDIPLVVGHKLNGPVHDYAIENRIEIIAPDNPNEDIVLNKLSACNASVFVMAAYGKILKKKAIDIPENMVLNLHGGKLPERRGSSPMNWALIEGDSNFSLSIIRVDEGIDTGDILCERTFEISGNNTIVDLHRIANQQFPEMLLEVIDLVSKDACVPVSQDEANAAYYPLRFPGDGLILWDMYTADEIHNRIRALTHPYPCAFTYYDGAKVLLVSSERCNKPHFGEPGRIYKTTRRGLLVCAKDECLWINEAEVEKDSTSICGIAKRYDVFATLKGTAEGLLLNRRKICDNR